MPTSQAPFTPLTKYHNTLYGGTDSSHTFLRHSTRSIKDINCLRKRIIALTLSLLTRIGFTIKNAKSALTLTAKHISGKENTAAKDWNDCNLFSTIFNRTLATTRTWCVTPKYPTANIHELETRSRSDRDKCVGSRLGTPSLSVHIPSKMILIGRLLARIIKEKVQQAIVTLPQCPSMPVLLLVFDLPPLNYLGRRPLQLPPYSLRSYALSSNLSSNLTS